MGKRRKCEIDKFTFVVQYTAIGKEHLQSRRDVTVVIEALLVSNKLLSFILAETGKANTNKGQASFFSKVKDWFKF